jgi:hypothetical protein
MQPCRARHVTVASFILAHQYAYIYIANIALHASLYLENFLPLSLD